MTIVEAGFRVGKPEFPDDYELKEWVFNGGEGEVWRATTARRDGSTFHEWAVKIVPEDRVETRVGEPAPDALRRWYFRAEESAREVTQLRLPDVVGAAEVFIGAAPHRPGEAGVSTVLYVVSEWINGVSLPNWLGQGDREFVDICEVATQLARIVDSITERPRGINHRDISPANVMVEADSGDVKLIDFTFAVPVRSGPVTGVINPGYTAPETRGVIGSAAADRYSFGAVIYYLLTGQPPPQRNAGNECRVALLRAGFPEVVARHVTALLAGKAESRPVSLVRWAAELQELASRFYADTGEPDWADVSIAIDNTGTASVVAAGPSTVASARMATGALWSLVPDGRENAPQNPFEVRAACDGAGNTIQFVVTRSDALWVGRPMGWSREDAASLAGGVAAVRTPEGSAIAFVVDPITERLTTVEARLDGRVLRSTGGPFVQRVLGAAVGPDGHPAVVVTSANGALAVVGPGGQVPLGADGFSLAGICVNKWGELQCLCARAGAREIVTFQQLYGRWTETELIETRGPVADMACVGRRGGISVAVAGDDGLWVASQQDGVLSEWQRLTAEPCQRVVLEVGAAWRLRLAALIGGRVAVATEDVSGSWSRGLKEL